MGKINLVIEGKCDKQLSIAVLMTKTVRSSEQTIEVVEKSNDLTILEQISIKNKGRNSACQESSLKGKLK